MRKIGAVIVVCVLMFVVYLCLTVVMPIIVDFTLAANSTISASGINTTLQPGSTEILIASPWILWWMPAIIGMAAIVLILRGYVGR